MIVIVIEFTEFGEFRELDKSLKDRIWATQKIYKWIS